MKVLVTEFPGSKDGFLGKLYHFGKELGTVGVWGVGVQPLCPSYSYMAVYQLDPWDTL